jgi:multidrug efflux system membrane fusion protein
MRRRWTILLMMLFAVGAAWFGLAPDRAASPQAVAASPAAPAGAAAVPVTEGRVETRDVPIWLSGIGSVQPLNAVTVKVRVDGQLDRVAFTEGQDVRWSRPCSFESAGKLTRGTTSRR